MGSIETGNVVLILLGVVLFFSGPLIVWRTCIGLRKKTTSWFSGIFNFIIAILFTFAGYFFVKNNLRGNPLVNFRNRAAVLEGIDGESALRQPRSVERHGP